MANAEIVVFETTHGTFEVELNRERAPITVENFVRYVKDRHYDGTLFHRVIPGFMVQGGGFSKDGQEKKTRSPIRLESGNGLKNRAGTVAMARTSDPDSATAQFFINLVDNAFLDHAAGNPGYAVFGKVVSGMQIVENVQYVKTGVRGLNEDWPLEEVIIKKICLKG